MLSHRRLKCRLGIVSGGGLVQLFFTTEYTEN